jgi:hypothetical protein
MRYRLAIILILYSDSFVMLPGQRLAKSRLPQLFSKNNRAGSLASRHYTRKDENSHEDSDHGQHTGRRPSPPSSQAPGKP